jgi:hypothetical protein
MDDGSFMKTVAKSAHIARIHTANVTAGQSACLAFSLNKEMCKKLCRGMVVLRESPTSTKEFDADICMLKGEGTMIRRSDQAYYIHILLNVCQSAFARSIEIVNNNAMGLPGSMLGPGEDDDDVIVLRPGSRAKVRFEFAQRPVCRCVCDKMYQHLPFLKSPLTLFISVLATGIFSSWNANALSRWKSEGCGYHHRRPNSSPGGLMRR